MYNNNFVPNYYPNLQNPYYNPPVQMPQTYSQQNNDLNNYQIPQQQNNDNDSGIVWVQGEAAAKAYPVLKNQTVVLWDSESPSIYIKSVDNSGMPSMRIIDWTDRKPQNNNIQENINTITNNNNNYVTRDEFDEIVKKVNNLSNKFTVNNKTSKNNSVKEEGENNG